MNEAVILRDFFPEDLDMAGEIALQIWGSESGLIPDSMRKNLYCYLARYYYVPESPLSCAATVDGKLNAFLLASRGELVPTAAEQWIMPRLSTAEKAIFRTYKAYIDGNQKSEAAFARANEAVLLLFASIKKGCGSMLMQEFQRRCRSCGLDSMILWTDDTCDFTWYERNKFTEVTRFPAVPSLPGMKLTTFIFRKDVK